MVELVVLQFSLFDSMIVKFVVLFDVCVYERKEREEYKLSFGALNSFNEKLKFHEKNHC